MIYFSVTNSRVTITGAPPNLIQQLDKYMQYPTQVADLQEMGIEVVETGWDGWVRLLRKPKTQPPWFPTGLLSMALWVVDSLELSNYVVVNDLREKPDPDVPELVDLGLFDYQQEAVDAAIKEGRGVVDLPPRAGKTLILCEVTRRLALPTVWIVPRDRIAKQTLATLVRFFGENYAIHQIGVSGQEEAKNRRIVICTDATARSLSQDFYESRQVIVVDEFHHAASATYKQIFKMIDHIYYRFGATGTFFRSGSDDLELYANISNVLYTLTSEDLKNRGRLVPVHACLICTPFKQMRGLESSWTTGYGKHGIHEHRDRNQLVAYTALFLQQVGRTVMVLVGTKKQGYQIKEILNSLATPPPAGTEFKYAEFISTDMPTDIQTRVLESFLSKQEIKVLIGTSILGEGVDLPSADALVYARGQKAEVALIQAMYRICTACEDKKDAILVDFADKHQSVLLKHSMSRLETYYEDPIFTVEVLQTPQEFPGWLTAKTL